MATGGMEKEAEEEKIKEWSGYNWRLEIRSGISPCGERLSICAWQSRCLADRQPCGINPARQVCTSPGPRHLRSLGEEGAKWCKSLCIMEM